MRDLPFRLLRWSMAVAISVVKITESEMVIVTTGLKTRPGALPGTGRDVVMMWPLLPMLSIHSETGFLMNIEQIETLTREIGQKATEKATLSED